MNMDISFGMPHMMFNCHVSDVKNPPSGDSSSSCSGSEDEAVVSVDSKSQKMQTNILQSDKFLPDSEIINLDKVYNIEIMLHFNEVISLIFLLYNRKIALQEIRTMLTAGPQSYQKGKISNWAQSTPNNWQSMLIEALAVIQNYQILEKIGLSRREVNVRFQPLTDTTLFLSRVRKILFRCIESLTIQEAQTVIELVQSDGKFKDDITLNYDCSHMEFHLLFWADRGYITIEEDSVNLENLTKQLKKIKNSYTMNQLNEIDAMMKNIRVKTELPVYNEGYPIHNANEIGVSIIINVETFYREKEEKYKDLLPHDDLEPRKGSEFDVEKLKDTFTHLKFKVVDVLDNKIPHYAFKNEIESLVKKHFQTIHSVLFVCVLSHGSEGVVYAANSIPISIEEIQNSICESNTISDLLANKPKVLVIQACQGTKKLLASACESDNPKIGSHSFDGSQLTFDSPGKFYPKYADILICMAIIEGYAAVRSILTGTVYIQELCRCLNKYYDKLHFSDIVTKVHHNLNEKTMCVPEKNQQKGRSCKKHNDCMNIYMTPVKLCDTLTKQLYLVQRQ